MPEQQIVHRPELLLRGGGFGCFGRKLCMRMDFRQREMSIRKANLVLEALEQHLHGRIGLRAVGAFEVAVLDESDLPVLGTDDVIGLVDADRECERIDVLTHTWSSSAEYLACPNVLRTLYRMKGAQAKYDIDD